MQLSLEGTPVELAAFCQAVGRQPKISDFAQAVPQSPVAKTLPENQPITYSPRPRPSKAASDKLRAIFGDYVKAGMTSQAIQEDLVKSWDIKMSLKQIAGWIGQVKGKQGMVEKPKEGSKAKDKVILPAKVSKPILGPLGLSTHQLDMIHKLYNKQHITPNGIAKELQIPLEKVEKVVGWA